MHRISVLCLVFVLSPAGNIYSRDQLLPDGIASLVQAERDFARASVQRGIRSSFLEYFADDAIVFQPHPVKYKQAVSGAPAPADPLAYTLDWEPIYSDISAAGDLGYNTGPYVLTDNSAAGSPPRHGFFFSVWKQQSGGDWKVVLDVGIDTVDAYTGSRDLATAAGAYFKPAGPAVSRADAVANLLAAEQGLTRTAVAAGMAGAYDGLLNLDSRLHRNGLQPLVGQQAILEFLSQKTVRPTWQPVFAEASVSGDLGYVYGSYELTNPDVSGPPVETGYYARLWKRDVNQQWLILLDTASPLE